MEESMAKILNEEGVMLPLIEWYRMITLRRADLTRDDVKLIASWDLYFIQQKRKINREKLKSIIDKNPILSPTSDTLFILGTGPSINALTENNWKIIARHDSVGLNFFLVHPFVPTYSYIEIKKSSLDSNGKPIASELIRASYERQLNKRKTIFLNVEQGAFPLAQQVVTNSGYDFFITHYRRFKTLIPDQLSRIVRALIDYGRKSDLLLHHSASVIFWIMLGALSGYSKIVLVGVDLNQPGYFFYDCTRYRSNAARIAREYKLRVEPIGEVDGNAMHLTADPKFTKRYGELDVLSTINVIQRAFSGSRRLGHIQMYCGTVNSALYPSLRPFEFH
jgi:hypothetical protein